MGIDHNVPSKKTQLDIIDKLWQDTLDDKPFFVAIEIDRWPRGGPLLPELLASIMVSIVRLEKQLEEHRHYHVTFPITKKTIINEDPCAKRK